MLTSLEVCAGAGGQALGLEKAGFEHAALVEMDKHACATLRLNRPKWQVHETDLNHFDGRPFKGVDLLAGGLPCPPFSIAGKQLGEADERNLFPAALRLVDEIRPRALMIENVRGILGSSFADYLDYIKRTLKKLGYTSDWQRFNAAEYGVPQVRHRAILVAVRSDLDFEWPEKLLRPTPTVGDRLADLMGERGWRGVRKWQKTAQGIAPTIVGGSKKHGGADLGPTRAKQEWAKLGVDGKGVADEAPASDFVGIPRLTVRMVARLQGFDDSWQFAGKKTASYRQVGNAFPAPVAAAVAGCISLALAPRGNKLRRIA